MWSQSEFNKVEENIETLLDKVRPLEQGHDSSLYILQLQVVKDGSKMRRNIFGRQSGSFGFRQKGYYNALPDGLDFLMYNHKLKLAYFSQTSSLSG